MIKRIVLFADVHGNITGLREVIKAAKKLENLEHIIGLGDYFGWGAGCNDVIELCRENDVILIRGGHEEILNLIDKYSLIGFHAALGDMESYTCGSDRPVSVLQETYGGLTENVVVYGHYHEPHVIPMGDKILINCASVGQRRKDNLSNYTIIEYDEEKIAVIQKQVPYDKAEEDRLVEERGMMRRL